MSVLPAAPPAASAERFSPVGEVALLARRVGAMCLVELQKLRHDRTELVTRAVQPALWLAVFGTTFSRDPRDPHRLDALPGLPRARDPGPVGAVHRDLLRHPGHLGARRRGPGETPRDAHAAGRPGDVEGVRGRHPGPGAGTRRRGHRRCCSGSGSPRTRSSCSAAAVVVVLGLGVLLLPVDHPRGRGALPRPADGHRSGDHHAAVLRLERALPGGADARAGCRGSTRSTRSRYEVDALRGLLIGTPARLGLDAVVLVVAAAVMISVASALLPRLARG